MLKGAACRAPGSKVVGANASCTLVLIALAGPRPASAADAFKVIVNARLAGRAVSRETLTQVYLGRVERWGAASR